MTADFEKNFKVKISSGGKLSMVGIAQLVRAPDCGSGGQGFNSLYSPHNGVSPSGKAWDSDSHTLGSNPSTPATAGKAVQN